MSRHNSLARETCRDLLALTTLDLSVYLVGTRIEQVDGLVLQLPNVAVVAQVCLLDVDALARDKLRGFEPYRRCLCYHWRAYRAGRQEEAEQPNHEQRGCCV